MVQVPTSHPRLDARERPRPASPQDRRGFSAFSSSFAPSAESVTGRRRGADRASVGSLHRLCGAGLPGRSGRRGLMRLWTLHPKYLDARGLVALWREGLLAQAVLRGRTSGYTNHPQLARFRDSGTPVGSISRYLATVHDEATGRGYRFDRARIARGGRPIRIVTTTGQLRYEWRHLKAKLALRDPEWLASLRSVAKPDSHPLFRVVRGRVEDWEVTRHHRRGRG
jgi:Pyrimidine dimer DNA glycosylase